MVLLWSRWSGLVKTAIAAGFAYWRRVQRSAAAARARRLRPARGKLGLQDRYKTLKTAPSLDLSQTMQTYALYSLTPFNRVAD